MHDVAGFDVKIWLVRLASYSNPHMAHFIVRHLVNAPFEQVKNTFTSPAEAMQLFKALSPPMPKAEILNFGGTNKGDLVKLKLDFGLWASDWVSHVDEVVEQPNYYHFRDVGLVMPLGMASFSHRHILKAVGQGQTSIEEDIDLSGKNVLFTLLNVIGFWVQMRMRRGAYQRFWSAN